MVRFFFRLLAGVSLAIATIFAVLDATRTVANSTLTLTPLVESWSVGSPHTLATAQDRVTATLGAFAWDPVALAVLSLPGFVVFATLALLLFIVGHRRERAPARFATEL